MVIYKDEGNGNLKQVSGLNSVFVSVGDVFIIKDKDSEYHGEDGFVIKKEDNNMFHIKLYESDIIRQFNINQIVRIQPNTGSARIIYSESTSDLYFGGKTDMGKIIGERVDISTHGYDANLKEFYYKVTIEGIDYTLSEDSVVMIDKDYLNSPIDFKGMKPSITTKKSFADLILDIAKEYKNKEGATNVALRIKNNIFKPINEIRNSPTFEDYINMQQPTLCFVDCHSFYSEIPYDEYGDHTYSQYKFNVKLNDSGRIKSLKIR